MSNFIGAMYSGEQRCRSTKAAYTFATILVLFAAATGIYAAFLRPLQRERLILATTTSTVDTGLLDYLKPYFENKFGANLTWLYLGTGQALQVGARGDADVLLVHDRVSEDDFVSSGNGTHRVTVMYNDFVIIGPKEDPAGILGLKNASAAFRQIEKAGEEGKTLFVSRGDKSGTNALELRIWSRSGVQPWERSWYLQAGQGMGPTVRMANEKRGYTLADRGTWIKLESTMGETLKLALLVEGDNSLLNPYGAILVNPAKHPNVKQQLAEKFIMFLVSEEGQKLISDFKVEGQQVFFTVFGKPESIGLPPETEEVQYWVDKLNQNGMKPPSWIAAVFPLAAVRLHTARRSGVVKDGQEAA